MDYLFPYAGDRVCSTFTRKGSKVWGFIPGMEFRTHKVDTLGKILIFSFIHCSNLKLTSMLVSGLCLFYKRLIPALSFASLRPWIFAIIGAEDLNLCWDKVYLINFYPYAIIGFSLLLPLASKIYFCFASFDVKLFYINWWNM